MELQQQSEWHLLRSRVAENYRSFSHVDISKYHIHAQILVRPSFADTYCIDILRRGDVLVAFQTVWQSTIDINAFASPVERMKHPLVFIPAIASRELEVDTETIENAIAILDRTDLGLTRTTNSISLDGTLYELHIGTGHTGIRVCWHHQLPDQWESLRSPVETMLQWATESQSAG